MRPVTDTCASCRPAKTTMKIKQPRKIHVKGLEMFKRKCTNHPSWGLIYSKLQDPKCISNSKVWVSLVVLIQFLYIYSLSLSLCSIGMSIHLNIGVSLLKSQILFYVRHLTSRKLYKNKSMGWYMIKCSTISKCRKNTQPNLKWDFLQSYLHLWYRSITNTQWDLRSYMTFYSVCILNNVVSLTFFFPTKGIFFQSEIIFKKFNVNWFHRLTKRIRKNSIPCQN